jgi:hypothetical protein
MTYAQRLQLRLFLEGVEVPVISANVQMQPNQPAVASIQIPANDYALDFKPRTLVHLFFYDFYRGAPPASRAFVAGEGIIVQQDQEVDPELQSILSELRINEATREQINTDLENENYKHLFGGEVVGIQVTKTPTTRGIVLQCMDWSSYWDYAFQYQVSGYNFGGGGIRAAFTGARTTVFNSFLEGSADIVTRLMATPPRSYPQLRNTLLGALVHIIEAIGGAYFGTRAVRGVNDFFSLAEMRLHLTQMVGANPFSNRDEQRLMRAHGFGSLFRRSLSGLGKQVSIRAVLNSLQKYIFHDIIPVTTPHYIPPLTDPRLPNFETVTIDEDDRARPVARAARRLKRSALELKERQQNSTTSDAARAQSRRRGSLARELTQLRRVAIRAMERSRRIGLNPREDRRFDRLFRFPGVSSKFSATAENFVGIKNATRRAQRTNVRTNTFFLAGSSAGQEVVRMCDRIASDMDFVLEARYRRRVGRATAQPDPPQRLITQVWRPDVWMVAPPRCNVLFPELYSQFTYARQFMQETSRLLLRTHSAFFGSDILFDGFYMAPSRALGARTQRRPGRGRVGVEPTDLIDAPAWFVRDLMEHELYTGILPKFERMSNLNLHALRGGSTVINQVRVGYAQLAVNHIFFKQRFQSRQLQISGKFNPFIVPAFPSVIVDKYQSRADIDNSEYDEAIAARIAEAAREGEGDIGGLPEEQQQEAQEASDRRVVELTLDLLAKQPNNHYLGTPVGLNHSVSVQGGGSTNMQMGYARTTNESTEFLGDARATTGRSRRFRRSRDQIVSNVIAWTSEPQVGNRGPRGGEIVEVEDVTDRYRRRQRARPSRGRRGTTATGQRRLRYASRSLLPLWVPGGQISGRRYRGTRVLVGVEQAASAYGPEVVALVGSIGEQQAGFITRNDGTRTEILVTFRAFRVRERIGVYERMFRSLPPEELVFPPWYGEHWSSRKVGGIYGYLFGTGSIVDPTTILSPPGSGDGRDILVGDGGDPSGVTEPRPIEADVPRVVDAEEIPAAGQTTQPETGGQPHGPPRADGEETGQSVLAEVEGRGDINQAIEELVRAYSRVRQERWDTNEFIRSYTWRPIASLVDMFGTANLEISEEGEVVQGNEGFHSRAFGDFDDLRQLVRNVEGRPPRILGLSLEDPDDARTRDSRRAAVRDQGVAQRLDTRKEKRVLVLRYMSALLASRGILG